MTCQLQQATSLLDSECSSYVIVNFEFMNLEFLIVSIGELHVVDRASLNYCFGCICIMCEKLVVLCKR